MFDADSPDEEKPQRSLLSLGPSAGRRPAGQGSSLSRDIDEDLDPAALHRLARSRREAAPNKLLAALATNGEARAEATASTRREPAAVADVKPGLGERIAGWFSGRTAAAPEPEPRPAARAATAREAYRPTIRQPVEPAARRAEAEARTHATADAANNGDQIWRPLIDPTKVIMGVFNSKALIVTTTILGALIAAALALSTPKKYESAAELLVDPRDLQLVDRNLTEGGLPSDATLAIVENQVRVITSGAVLNAVVEKLKLYEDPEFNGTRESFGIRTIISALRALISSGAGAGGGDGRRYTLAVENLAEALSVERGGRTFVVVIAAKTEDPEKSALIANTVTDVFLETYGKLQSATAARAAGELTAQLDDLRKGVEDAERKVETFKAEHDLIDAQGRLIGDEELLKLNDQLATARARTIELNAKAASTRSANVDAAIGGVLPEEISSNVMVELRSQYASLKREADRLGVNLGPRHPQRQAIDTELAGLRNEIANELRRIVSSVQTELKRAVQLEQELAARLAQLKVRQGDVSGDLVTLRELEREATAKRAVYEAFLLRARETGEQKNINTANMSVISQAFPPLDPTGPSRSVVAITGAVLGFITGLLLGALRGAMSSLRGTLAARRQRGGSSARMEGGAGEYAADVTPEPAAPSDVEPSPREAKPIFNLFRSRKPAEPVPAEPKPSATPAAEAPMYHYPHPLAVPAHHPYAPQTLYPQAPQPVYPPMPVYAQPAYPMPQPYMPVAAPMPVYPQPAYAAPAYPYPPQPVQPTIWQQPPYPHPQAAPAQPAEPRYAEPMRPRTEVDAVRDSLREFRDAVREVSEDRIRRRSY
ncbi:MAG TPA: Wzz/FepE/Etk N-terminal domain-containing protein [Rhizobiaceae bacterium]|nr:Wzz/FepE/Etk N-terminal domain-containing protein [Rhizobiaceae bacterium]